MEPMYLSDVENSRRASGWRVEMIQNMRAANIPVPQILHLLAFKPEVTKHLEAFTQSVMRGPSPLSPALRELTFTSSHNRCPFCRNSHAAVAAELIGDESLVQAVLQDYTTATISEPERALLEFVAKITENPSTVGLADIKKLRSHGWSDEAIYDAVTVCALFNFYNRWVSATGVHDMPREGYVATGRRLATQGYAEPAAKSAPIGERA